MTRGLVVVAALLLAGSYALGLKLVWAYSERECPPAHEVYYSIGQVTGGVWRCLPVAVTPPSGDMEWWNNLPTGYRDQRVGVYLGTLHVRLFSYDNVSGGPLFIGLGVPAPSD